MKAGLLAGEGHGPNGGRSAWTPTAFLGVPAVLTQPWHAPASTAWWVKRPFRGMTRRRRSRRHSRALRATGYCTAV